MRWKKKIRKPKKKPGIGEERTLYGFAYLPRLIGDTWIWLERYKLIAIWSSVDPHSIGSRCEWQVKEYELINRV